MPQYYNFSVLAGNEGYIDFIQSMSFLSGYWLGYMLLSLIFIIPLIVMLRNGKEPNTVFMVCSLYTMVGGIIFYVTGITPNGLSFYVPMIVLVITVIVRWYNSFR